ncbi:MAG: prepilin-type N-terminal cleavage/methylation domain-containing protein [Clostridia bacterium]|jgi:prepilin-type N-terminal cleavage/methylation domain-containing protein|nr:prepilin-type N-terminal cleavage/methylation domain-containing protein [Clostridia bacterium]MDH7572635.1 prepilin-type N-terminal cleavage/methylation domain-containing protein [Clostridia bacterium]
MPKGYSDYRPVAAGFTFVEVLAALAVLALALVPLMDLYTQSLRVGERAGEESLLAWLAQGKMEQYLYWFRQYQGQGPTLGQRLQGDGVDLDPSDGVEAEFRPFAGFPDYAYRAFLTPAYGDASPRQLRKLKVEVRGPGGHQAVLTTLVW